MKDLGLPISNSGGSIITKPSPSPAPSIFSSVSVSSRSSAAASISRPSSGIQTSSRGVDSTSLAGRNYSSGASFKGPARPSNFNEEGGGHSIALSYLNHQNTGVPSNSTSSGPAAALTNMLNSSHGLVRQQPSFYLSQMGKEVRISPHN